MIKQTLNFILARRPKKCISFFIARSVARRLLASEMVLYESDVLRVGMREA
jgi:hypothetical protein